uniref:DUF932 domain-containing protein n=1 Tax=viral metagenome TaxID=1070528 RepID=A0A6M3JR75_9ZZZZ
MELFQANHQWSTRPDDEKFNNLHDLYNQTLEYASMSKESVVPWDGFDIIPSEKNLLMRGKQSGREAVISNWAFGQLCSRAQAPAAYLRTLPPQMASDNLNYGLVNARGSSLRDAKLLFHTNGRLTLRALTTEAYSRLWNYEVAERLMELSDRYDLQPAKSTFRQRDPNEKPALYASDHDMFVFLMSKEREIEDGLFRGCIVVNSEVGDKSLGLMRFLFREICGNHIIWDASQIAEIKVRHVGHVRDTFGEFSVSLRQYLDSSTYEEQQKMQAAKTFKIAASKEDVLDALFGNRRIGLTRKVLEASYEAVNPDEDGDPNTVFGFVGGLTRHSQTIPYADQRTELDKGGRKIMQMAF